jgi:hypothetical protein
MHIQEKSRNPFVSLTIALSLIGQAPLAEAQGVDPEKALDQMFDGSVLVDHSKTDDEIRDEVIAAIGHSSDMAEEVRKLFKIDRMILVGVSDEVATAEPVKEAMAKNEEGLIELRQAVEGSALLYNMLESRGLLMSDLVAAEFLGENNIRLYVTGNPEA